MPNQQLRTAKGDDSAACQVISQTALRECFALSMRHMAALHIADSTSKKRWSCASHLLTLWRVSSVCTFVLPQTAGGAILRARECFPARCACTLKLDEVVSLAQVVPGPVISRMACRHQFCSRCARCLWMSRDASRAAGHALVWCVPPLLT